MPTVSTTITVAGEPDSFDGETFRGVLLARYNGTVHDVVLEIDSTSAASLAAGRRRVQSGAPLLPAAPPPPASTVVDARFIMLSAAGASGVQADIQTIPPASASGWFASAGLNVTILGFTPPMVVNELILAPFPPSPSPPPFPPRPPGVPPPLPTTPGCPSSNEGQGTFCAPGKELVGTYCAECPAGGFCQGGQRIECSDGTFSIAEGASSIGTCRSCPPAGVSCTTHTSIEVLRGYYMGSANDSLAYRCATAKACVGGDSAFGDVACEVGYEGLLCGGCIAQYYRGRRQCLPCAAATSEESNGSLGTFLMLPLASAFVFMAAMVYLRPPTPPDCGTLGRAMGRWRNRFARTQLGRNLPEYLTIVSALAKISLGYTQCLGAIIRFPLVAWPIVFTDFIETLDVLNLEIFAIIPAECITGECH